MRTKDQTKIKAIKEAVINLSESEGLTHLTTAKVAKMAGVSPATIYLNYQDKTDMLTKIYFEVKHQLHDGLEKAIEQAGESIEARVRAALKFSVNQEIKYPKESKFLNSLWINQELLDKEIVKKESTQEGPLIKLFSDIKKSSDFIDTSSVIMDAFFTIPTTVAKLNNYNSDLTDETIDLVIKALKK